MEIVSLIFGLTYAAVGIGGLLGLTLAPRVLNFWPYNTRLFLGNNLAKTQRNRAIVSVMLVIVGLYVAFADSLARPWRLVALGTLFVLTLIYIFVREPAEAGS